MQNNNDYKLNERILCRLSFRKNPSLRGAAEEIGISSSKLRKKVAKMRKEKIILSWSLVINPMSMQEQKIFFFLLKTNPNEPKVVTKLLENYDLSKLSHLEGITGEYSLIGKFHFPNASEFLFSLDHLYKLVGETGFKKYQLLEVIKVYKEQGIPCPETSKQLKAYEVERLKKIQFFAHKTEFPPSTYQMAKKLGVSQPVIYRQLKNWKEEKVILGYSLHSSFWQNNYLHSYIQIKAPLGEYQSLINFCLQNNRVVNIYRTNQEYSLLLKTRHPNLADLNNFLKTTYQQAEVEDTLTRIVLDLLRDS